ncbi:MAG: hypothetical protein WCA85_22970 [Paraburkholderia sp.]|uniref:hypothetical protein n=1 Tax=Paraburkholderia sp. TaxID=1926495 RepID=UPI003C37F3EE
MANVQIIIDALRDIASENYMGHPSSRKSMHELAFDRLQASATQVADILDQNRVPNNDMKENIQAQFESMKKNVDSYCLKTAGTEPVLIAFSKAQAEWDALMKGI